MLTIQHQFSLAETRPVPVKSKPLIPGTPPSRTAAAPPQQWYTHRNSNSLQNGRLEARLGTNSWRVRWSHPLASAPSAILRGEDRILVQGGGWQLLTADGKPISEGSTGRGSASIDPKAGLFYLVNPTNYLEARSLKTGDLTFQSPLLTNERFAWPLIARFGVRMLLMGAEQPIASHVPRPGTRAEIDMLEVEPQLRVDLYKQILSLSRSEILHFDKSPMLFAAGTGFVYAAASNYLVVAESGLNVSAVYEADFKPVSLSVDESGFMHMIVESGGRKAFWVVMPDGRRIVQAALADEHQSVSLPPVLAFHHQTFLLTRSAVLAFSPEGSLMWQRQMAGDIAGASVTQDDKLLVAAGSELTILDAAGHQLGVHHFPGEQLTTAPVLTRTGDRMELLVGTRAQLHSLVSE